MINTEIHPLSKKVIYVASYGGCGSKALCSYLSNFATVKHIHSRAPPDELEFIGKNENTNCQCSEWFNGLKVPVSELENYYVIYIYKDPVKAIISRYHNPAMLWRSQCPNCNITIADVVADKKDHYDLKRFYQNYTTHKRRNYIIYAVRYEDLFNNKLVLEEIHEIIDIPSDPNIELIKIERDVTAEPNVITALEEIYKDLKTQMAKGPSIKSI